jgi:hypothetical protein
VGEVLAVVALTTLVLAGLTALVVAWLVHRLRRRNLVSRQYRNRAPLHWIVSPGQCARLHRRLRASVVALHTALPPPKGRAARAKASPLAAAAGELEAHAASLDRDVVLAARLRGRTGPALRARLAGQVEHLEQVTARVAAAANASTPARPGVRPTPEALAELDEQLDALEAARDELARVEARAGLGPPVSA